MPFEAAKALAIQFCYRIRYALTPMFGTDFPDLCLDERHENFGRMILDQSIIEQAARTAHYYYSLESQTLPGDAIVGMESTISTASSNSPAWRAEMPICPPALLDEDRTRSQKWPRRSYTDSIASTRGSSSEPYCMSPSSPVSNCFTPVNAPRSHVSATEAFLSREANPRLDVPQHATLSPPTSGSRAECNPTAGNYDDSDTDVTSDSVENDSADDEDWREHESRCSTESGIVSDADRSKATCSRAVKARTHHRPSIPKHFAQEVKAAHALIHLHMQEATADDEDDGALVPDGSSSDVVRRMIRTPDQSHGGRKRRRASV